MFMQMNQILIIKKMYLCNISLNFTRINILIRDSCLSLISMLLSAIKVDSVTYVVLLKGKVQRLVITQNKYQLIN